MGIAVAQPGRLTERQWPMLVGRGCASAEARFALIAERLVDAAGLRAGDAVLDVATGSGEAAIAAARRGCVVTGVDDVAALSERARERAAVEGLDVTFAAGDAERLPCPDASFDAVLSCLGVMFTPRHQQAAGELVRVCRPRGTIALASWTPAGFVGRVFQTVAAHVPSLRWDFGDGQAQSTASPVTTHTYNQRGPKSVTLTVIDDSGSSDRTQETVVVRSASPRPSFSAPATTAVGHPVTFDASASFDPNAITGYRWNFGDGQTRTTTIPTVSHTYHTSGTLTVTLTITDDAGGAAIWHAIKVLPRGCVVPRLVGRKLGGARQALKAAGCRLGAVKRKHAGRGRRRRVIRQSIATGAVRPPGAAVSVTVRK